jgi:dolichol kinase
MRTQKISPPTSLSKTVSSKKVSPNELSWRREVFRQSIHVSLGLFLSGVLFFSNLDFFRQVCFALLGAGVALSLVARANIFPALNGLLEKVERKNEFVHGQSAFMFVLGALIPALVFSNPLFVFLGVFALTWQDGFSTLFGVRFGKTVILRGKTVEGSLGGLVACTLGLSLILPFPNALILALIATLVELVPVDDSLSIPLVVSIAAAAFV